MTQMKWDAFSCHHWTLLSHLPTQRQFHRVKHHSISCVCATNWNWRHPVGRTYHRVQSDVNGIWIYLAKRIGYSRCIWCIWRATNCTAMVGIGRDSPRRIHDTRWMKNHRADVVVHYHPKTIYTDVRPHDALSCRSVVSSPALHQPAEESLVERACIGHRWCRAQLDDYGSHCS